MSVLATPIGELRLLVRADGPLSAILFAGQALTATASSRSISPAAARTLREASSQLSEYFAGVRERFELPLAPEGTAFQRSVWTALASIGYAQTRSYSEIARAIGRPSAARAVGAANGQNPLPIVLPCHRVIGRSGALTGYAGGLDRKRYLLELEAQR
jgi:methylated-DNA-[protein]-cysteine S-methyltransferase